MLMVQSRRWAKNNLQGVLREAQYDLHEDVTQCHYMRPLKVELHWSSVSTDGFHTTSSRILRFLPTFLFLHFSLYNIQYAKCKIKQIYKSNHLCNGSGCDGSVERLGRWGRSLSSWSRSTQAKKSGEINIIIITVITIIITTIIIIVIITTININIINTFIIADLAVNVVVGIWSIGERGSKLGGGHLVSIGFSIWPNYRNVFFLQDLIIVGAVELVGWCVRRDTSVLTSCITYYSPMLVNIFSFNSRQGCLYRSFISE